MSFELFAINHFKEKRSTLFFDKNKVYENDEAKTS